MDRRRSVGVVQLSAALALALACGPQGDPEPPSEPEPAPAPAPAPDCGPVPWDGLIDAGIAAFETRYWRYAEEGSDLVDDRLTLHFANLPKSAYLGAAVAGPGDDIGAALVLPSGAAFADMVALTDEQLAGIGERAAGFTITRTVYRDHPRGTRRTEWTVSELSFTRCRLVVRVGGEIRPETTIAIARELDAWLDRHGYPATD